MHKTKLFYDSSPYLSFHRPARVYREVLRTAYDFVEDVDEADIVILHGPPTMYDRLMRVAPSLRTKYVVGYYIWEASDLPDSFKRSVSRVNEVWTCSAYCATIFRKYHPRVHRVPHAIERHDSVSDCDRHLVARLIDFDPELTYFLSIAKVRDKRKNMDGLISAFRTVAHSMPRARLVLKIWPDEQLDTTANDQIRVLPSMLSDSQIGALYEYSDIYVSPHHSEGLGFTLADAMLLRKPVLATGYSGNLDFMNPDNSFLLTYTESHIKPEDVCFLFDSTMKWAYPDHADLQQKLLFLYQHVKTAEVSGRTSRALQDIGRFSRQTIRDMLISRLDAIVSEIS